MQKELDDIVNSRFKDLSAKLGDLEFRKSLLNSEIEKVKKEIDKLNEAYPLIKQFSAEAEKKARENAVEQKDQEE